MVTLMEYAMFLSAMVKGGQDLGSIFLINFVGFSRLSTEVWKWHLQWTCKPTNIFSYSYIIHMFVHAFVLIIVNRLGSGLQRNCNDSSPTSNYPSATRRLPEDTYVYLSQRVCQAHL